LKRTAHGNPILVTKDNTSILKPIDILLEKDIQNLIFDNPECLPISDIDESYNPVIPICKELYTNAGPLDIFMITPNGDLVIIETKLWSNPESRRKVVAQILDYAKELSKWTYSDLQRELNRKLNTKGNVLFDIASKFNSGASLNEIDFVDAVSRNLRIGKFMLIIAGDGIREGAKNLTEFINKAGNLNFSLAMVELAIFKTPNDELILFPRTVVKTVEIQKINIEVSEGIIVTSNLQQVQEDLNNAEVSEEVKEKREFFTNFWTDFIFKLKFDDPEQPEPKVTKGPNLYIYPGKDKNNWISCYFMQSTKRVGVYFKFHSNQMGQSQKEQLNEYKEDIKVELGDEVIWSWDNSLTDGFGVRMNLEDVYDSNNRESIINFFSTWSNTFVNIMRPKLKQIE
jgi:hypothetical protein